MNCDIRHMSKQDSITEKDANSICDIMKDNTSAVIHELESHMPTSVQSYSDLYAAYLHMYDDILGTCYMTEKIFFDKLEIDPGVLRELKKNSESLRKIYVENIDIASKMFNEYVKMRVSAINSFDNYIHTMMESHTRMLSQFNKSENNQSK